jgi:stringent starvation protein B
MSPTQPLPPKKEVALALLERSSVYVHLDPRPPVVTVPVGYKKQPQLVLQVGMNMHVPIPDLQVDDEGVRCTLSFNRTPFYCVVPWSSVFAMVGEDGRGMVWPEDVPAEVARQAQSRPAEAMPRKDAPKAAPARAEGKRAEARSPESVVGGKAKRPRKRPALAAVPDEQPASQPAAQSAEVRDEVAAAASPRPALSPSPPTRLADNAKRRKRELPPYLRVVK